ncbi:glycoside hydrolase [Vibrio chagasii]|nr:glycoside hydrolase [Vibrio chagasii]
MVELIPKTVAIDSIIQSLKSLYSVESPTLADNTIEAQYIAAQSRKKWLFEHASSFLNSPDTWGQALSSGMVDNLNNAGLNKLWLGFDNWMLAFYQPNAVELAKQFVAWLGLTTPITPRYRLAH